MSGGIVFCTGISHISLWFYFKLSSLITVDNYSTVTTLLPVGNWRSQDFWLRGTCPTCRLGSSRLNLSVMCRSRESYNMFQLLVRFRRRSVQKPWKSTFSITHCRLASPLLQRTPTNIRINLILPETIESLAHISAVDTVWVYLHSNFCGALRNTHLFCNRVHIGHSWSSKVVDFGTNRKGVCDFLLDINSNFGPILHRFWYGDLLAENCEFSYPTLITPSLGVNPFEFMNEFFIPKRVLGLSVGEDFVILACVIFTQCQSVTDRRTYRHPYRG